MKYSVERSKAAFRLLNRPVERSIKINSGSIEKKIDEKWTVIESLSPWDSNKPDNTNRNTIEISEIDQTEK